MSCLFVHDFRSYTRDGEVYTGNLSYEIWKERYIKYFGNVKVINRMDRMKEGDEPQNYVKASGPNIEFIDEVDIFSPASFLINYKKYKEIIYRYVDKEEYIIIRLDSFLGLIAARRCREKGKKYLIEVVGCVWDSFWNKGVFGKIVAYPLMKRMQKEIRLANYVVYVTEKFLQKRYPTNGRSTNISNVFLSLHNDALLEKRINRIEAINNQPYQIVTIASVSVRYKGQESVIKALGDLKKNGKINFTYHLIGTGNPEYLKEVAKKENVEDQIFFYGGMRHDDVIAFLDKCDIYIQPSKQEGLPRALIEGMSRGMLCFGSNVAGIPELLEKEMLFSVRKGNHSEIAYLLSRVSKDQLVNQAKRNYLESQKYEAQELNKRRDDFFISFRDHYQIGE